MDTAIKVEMSRFKYKELQCPFCKRAIEIFEEKENYVSIALKMIELFLENECNVAVLMSGDKDLEPDPRLLMQNSKGNISFPTHVFLRTGRKSASR